MVTLPQSILCGFITYKGLIVTRFLWVNDLQLDGKVNCVLTVHVLCHIDSLTYH